MFVELIITAEHRRVGQGRGTHAACDSSTAERRQAVRLAQDGRDRGPDAACGRPQVIELVSDPDVTVMSLAPGRLEGSGARLARARPGQLRRLRRLPDGDHGARSDGPARHRRRAQRRRHRVVRVADARPAHLRRAGPRAASITPSAPPTSRGWSPRSVEHRRRRSVHVRPAARHRQAGDPEAARTTTPARPASRFRPKKCRRRSTSGTPPSAA